MFTSIIMYSVDTITFYQRSRSRTFLSFFTGFSLCCDTCIWNIISLYLLLLLQHDESKLSYSGNKLLLHIFSHYKFALEGPTQLGQSTCLYSAIYSDYSNELWAFKLVMYSFIISLTRRSCTVVVIYSCNSLSD